MDTRYFSDKVVEWYKLNKRDLPWRDTRDPYRVWLSEIILQQTRVNQGLPYYRRFLETFPTVHALAKATEHEVLRLWQGLGYYTRARNLHKCAKVVVSRYKGEFPNNFKALLTLPGVGEYTAAAIASFSFREPVAVVDGNVFRVLSRIFGIDDEINSPQGKKVFAELANRLISKNFPDTHNQAIMEFGALHCVPKNPPCVTCDFQSGCFASQRNLQSDLPRKSLAKASRKRYFYYVVIQKGKSLLMRKREGKDIWHGLYDFFLLEKSRPLKTDKLLDEVATASGGRLAVEEVEISKNYKHILTHQVIHAKFVLIKTGNFPLPKDGKLKFYTFEKIYDLPKPVLIIRFLTDYKNFYS
jgi:A/G-specific adenine glycosylase